VEPVPRPFGRSDVATGEVGLWRYSASMPWLAPNAQVRLGETVTPLVRTECLGAPCLLKLDYLLPTGSFKDRGVAIMISGFRQHAVRDVIEDSSGNAGASVAAYAAAAGMTCTIYAPSAALPAKLSQIRAYGARLMRVPGTRDDVSSAVLVGAKTSVYASHNHQAAFLAGVATLGFELWEQLGHVAPDSVAVPAGYGSLVLGLRLAFEELRLAGEIERAPMILAVQTEAYPSLAQAWEASAHDVKTSGGAPTIADGIACRLPLRGRSVLASLRATNGLAMAVAESEVRDALRNLAHAGFYPEPTGAVSAAGFSRLARMGLLKPGGQHVVVLSGSGLKAGSAIAEILGATEEAET
jgi:threonine synthase